MVNLCPSVEAVGDAFSVTLLGKTISVGSDALLVFPALVTEARLVTVPAGADAETLTVTVMAP